MASRSPAAGRSVSPSSRRKPLPFNPNINITPEYLVFPPPHQGRAIQNVIYVYNTGDVPCVYKLRTQNPNRYVAKPNVAVVGAKSATRIKVTLCVTKEEGNIAPETQERFRISVKSLRHSPGDAPAKEVWSAATQPITHEKDIIAYFRADMPTPAGGMVTFLPEKYATAAADAHARSGERSVSRPRNQADPMSRLRSGSTSGATPAKGADASTTGGDTPQARRQLASELDSAARDTPDDGSDGGSVGVRKPRSWRSFAWATFLAVVLAVCADVGFFLHAEWRAADGSSPSVVAITESADVAAPGATAQTKETVAAPVPMEEGSVTPLTEDVASAKPISSHDTAQPPSPGPTADAPPS